MSSPFQLIMISAMYENGGNTTQRLLDGHPALFSYPFESQLGTRYVQDHLLGLYPLKYRWPVFPLQGSPAEDYESIVDEECKVRLRTPHVSKFRDRPLSLDDAERKELFVRYASEGARTRPRLVEAFFRATADAWKDYQRSGTESVHVGYSPIVGVDAGHIVADSPRFHVLNVVRNPLAAYADTKKRPVPLSIAHYTAGWLFHQLQAIYWAGRHPDRVFILRYEDLIADPAAALGRILGKLGLGPSPTLARPSWNGTPLAEVYPWGTIRTPTEAANQATIDELSRAEKDEIRARTQPLLGHFGYA
jgi:hypothetical protein